MIWGLFWEDWYKLNPETFVYTDEEGPIKCLFFSALHICWRPRRART